MDPLWGCLVAPQLRSNLAPKKGGSRFMVTRVTRNDSHLYIKADLVNQFMLT